MGRVVVSEVVSLDGVMEAPGGEEGYAHSGWTFDFPDEGQYAFKLEETLAAEALLLGRVTYEGFAAAWRGTNRRGRLRRQDEQHAETSSRRRSRRRRGTTGRFSAATSLTRSSD
ncbi:MAG TPA: hypothetical protein VE440_09815 [Gaiellaceae bacterium]|nr:hypothetical protein [Gaiellaceae bacterium]